MYLSKEAGDNRRAKVNTVLAGHLSFIPRSLDRSLAKMVSQTAISPIEAIWTSPVPGYMHTDNGYR